MRRLFSACVVLVVCAGMARAAAQDADTRPGAGDAAASLAEYDSRFRESFGAPPATHAIEFVHELMAGRDFKLDRDSHVEHLKKALDLRPNDPANIAIEFQLTIELTQHNDPRYHQQPRRPEGQQVAEHIVATYDHKAYYRDEPEPRFDSTEYMVPWSATWASEYARVFGHDPSAARKYAGIALDDVYWTFHKRRAAWANAPPPATRRAVPDSFDDDFDPNAALLGQWKRRKADAAAGNVLGPDGKVLIQTIINNYLQANAKLPDEQADVLRQAIAKYSDFPISTLAAAQLAKLPAAARQPLTAVAERPTIPTASRPAAYSAVPTNSAPRWIIWSIGIVCLAVSSAGIVVLLRWRRA